jgi:adenosylcobyric acid synthase
MGRTVSATPWLEIIRRTNTIKVGVDSMTDLIPDGASSPDGRIWGCYLHGLFASTPFRHAWLHSLGWQADKTAHDRDDGRVSQALSRLTDAVEAALDMKMLEEIIWGN